MPADRGSPQRGREIAQCTDSLLEVRLEQVERRTEAIVTGLLLARECGDEVVGVSARRECTERRADELGRQTSVPGDMSGVEQGRRGREIVLREPCHGACFAKRVTDRELLVPQRVEQAIA